MRHYIYFSLSLPVSCIVCNVILQWNVYKFKCSHLIYVDTAVTDFWSLPFSMWILSIELVTSAAAVQSFCSWETIFAIRLILVVCLPAVLELLRLHYWSQDSVYTVLVLVLLSLGLVNPHFLLHGKCTLPSSQQQLQTRNEPRSLVMDCLGFISACHPCESDQWCLSYGKWHWQLAKSENCIVIIIITTCYGATQPILSNALQQSSLYNTV